MVTFSSEAEGGDTSLKSIENVIRKDLVKTATVVSCFKLGMSFVGLLQIVCAEGRLAFSVYLPHPVVKGSCLCKRCGTSHEQAIQCFIQIFRLNEGWKKDNYIFISYFYSQKGALFFVRPSQYLLTTQSNWLQLRSF